MHKKRQFECFFALELQKDSKKALELFQFNNNKQI